MDRKRLLIVDDSHLIVRRLIVLLDGLPGLGPIDSAATYAQAITRLSAPPLPDFILLDINLPDRNGISLLRHIHAYHPEIVVIMLSNQAGVFYRELCQQLGAAHFIDKSTEFQYVPTLIANLCGEGM